MMEVIIVCGASEINKECDVWLHKGYTVKHLISQNVASSAHSGYGGGCGKSLWGTIIIVLQPPIAK